ncbi:hypothetical protein ABZ871_11665 [Streptomyces populi]
MRQRARCWQSRPRGERAPASGGGHAYATTMNIDLMTAARITLRIRSEMTRPIR